VSVCFVSSRKNGESILADSRSPYYNSVRLAGVSKDPAYAQRILLTLLSSRPNRGNVHMMKLPIMQ
jgi:hypothetical protein